MKCSVARKLISEYIDSNLEARKNSYLEQHLDTCPGCQKLLKDFQGIVKEAQDLKESSPSEKIWLKMKERLEAKEQEVHTLKPQKIEWFTSLLSPPKLKYALSAALLLAVIVATATLGLWYRQGGKVLGSEDRQKYTVAKLEEAEHHYQLAIKALWEAALAQEGSLDPQVVAVFQRNLEAINSSIVACKEAVLREPSSIENRNYLLAAYQGKIDFLNEMMKVKKESSRERELKTTI